MRILYLLSGQEALRALICFSNFKTISLQTTSVTLWWFQSFSSSKLPLSLPSLEQWHRIMHTFKFLRPATEVLSPLQFWGVNWQKEGANSDSEVKEGISHEASHTGETWRGRSQSCENLKQAYEEEENKRIVWIRWARVRSPAGAQRGFCEGG